MSSRRLTSLLFIFTLGLLLVFSPARAQEYGELTLSLDRNFGYSLGGDIQGNFTLQAEGPEGLQRVAFRIDGTLLGEDVEPPFRLQFSTDRFTPGVHVLSASGYTPDGRELLSNEIRANFLSAEEGWRSVVRILAPILAIVFLAAVISFVLPWLLGRGKAADLPAGAPRRYGFSGGAICPKCERPFALHAFSLNLLVGKLERCPYCGRWSVVRQASRRALAEAEAAELEKARREAPEPPLDEEERLRRDLEDSRFM